MNKVKSLAIAGLHVLVLAATVHGAEPAQDPWLGWQPIELPEAHQQLIEQINIDAIDYRIDATQLNQRASAKQMPSSTKTDLSARSFGKESTARLPSNQRSARAVVAIPENASYQEWVGALVEAYPDLEKEFSEIESYKEAQNNEQDAFNAQFDREWQALVSDSGLDREAIEIPEAASFEEFQQLLKESRPELQDPFEQMNEIRKEHEKMREEFLKEFEKEWDDSAIPQIDQPQFNMPQSFTP